MVHPMDRIKSLSLLIYSPRSDARAVGAGGRRRWCLVGLGAVGVDVGAVVGARGDGGTVKGVGLQATVAIELAELIWSANLRLVTTGVAQPGHQA